MSPAVQVGVHGAGLINAFFMRPGSAMVEIFPCRFPADWASHYFWRPALVEGRMLPFQIHMQDESRCRPSELEREPGGDAPYLSRDKYSIGVALCNWQSALLCKEWFQV